MQQRLNFTYKVRKTLFGVLQPDQVTWNGMVGELQASRAHVGIAPLRITTFRQRAIDYTIPTKVLQNRIYLRQPDVEASWNLYAEPFNAILWTCVLGFIFVVALSARLLHVVAARAHLTNEVVSSSDVFFDAFASLVQQSGTLNPETSSERLLWFFVYWTSVLLFTSYSAVLIALLTTVRPTLPFTDFESLLLRPDWNLVIVQNRALSDYLALAPEGSTLKKVWDKHVMSDPAKNRPVAMDAAVALVLQGKHALLVAEETMAVAMHMMPKEDAFKIIHTGKYFFNSPAAFSVPKNSPYLELFNHVLSRMRESGQMGRLLNKWNRELVQPPSDIYPSPGLTETFVLFLVLGVGILVSCGILISERIIVARSAPRATRPPSLDHSTTWVPTTARVDEAPSRPTSLQCPPKNPKNINAVLRQDPSFLGVVENLEPDPQSPPVTARLVQAVTTTIFVGSMATIALTVVGLLMSMGGQEHLLWGALTALLCLATAALVRWSGHPPTHTAVLQGGCCKVVLQGGAARWCKVCCKVVLQGGAARWVLQE
ncbi:glutamate receptor ionotropic, kainate glr-3-like [Hyalella azteca]|uniref:Glutamate receptor ionotropic, kainate glr-3-like n=1 Tax=Hyalella azteca TaxID=294128 RepID=A0A979FII7_HYAAZ|nr:glutamate receptor ionotropic, kainate glr-3-like [Hyalella azteca]